MFFFLNSKPSYTFVVTATKNKNLERLLIFKLKLPCSTLAKCKSTKELTQAFFLRFNIQFYIKMVY